MADFNTNLNDPGVEFLGETEQRQIPQRRFVSSHKTSFMVGLVLKTGIVKTPGQANIVLLIIAFISLGLSFYFFSLGRSPRPSTGEKQFSGTVILK